MIFEFSTSKQILAKELSNRVAENPAYSANAFAKKLQISQSYLSLLLTGKRRLTKKVAFSIAERLKYDSTESSYFMLLCSKESTADKEVQCLYDKKIEALKKKHQVDELGIEKFQVISDWYYSAILECLNLSDINHTPQAYAEKLNLDVETIEEALEKLEKLELIHFKSSRYFRNDTGFLDTPSGIKSKGLRSFHSQTLKKSHFSIRRPTNK